jgi:hypothetical protein
MKSIAGSFDPILCHSCGKLTHLSTRMGVHMPCANGCGAVHVALGVVVVSGDDIPKASADLTEQDLAEMTPAEILARLRAV